MAQVAIAIVIGVVIMGVGVLTYAFLREKHTMNHTDRRLYKEAAVILNRLINITELDGDFAADQVSPATRKVIDKWLVDYRKEINKL